jgi:hypothetical protein
MNPKWYSLERCTDYMTKNINSDLSMIYEFGVFDCSSLVYIEKLSKIKNVNYSKIIGFDSFEGFPSFEKEYAADPNTYQAWETMDFSCVKDKSQIDSVIASLKTKFIDEPILVPGYYENSLKDELVTQYDLKPALFVHIDCDLYTSTYTVLDFLYRNNLIQSGTIVKYDEWGPLFKPGEPFGEERAHLEMLEKYGGSYEQLETMGDKIIFRRL